VEEAPPPAKEDLAVFKVGVAVQALPFQDSEVLVLPGEISPPNTNPDVCVPDVPLKYFCWFKLAGNTVQLDPFQDSV
jgi:hypothetical protein